MSLTLLCSDRVKQVWGSSWASVGEGFGALNASEPQLCLNGSGDWHLLKQLLGGSARCTSCLCTHHAPRRAPGGTQEALVPLCLQGKRLHFREQSAGLTLVPTLSALSQPLTPPFRARLRPQAPAALPQPSAASCSSSVTWQHPGRCFWLPAGLPSHNHQKDYRIVATT